MHSLQGAGTADCSFCNEKGDTINLGRSHSSSKLGSLGQLRLGGASCGTGDNPPCPTGYGVR